MSDIHTKCLAEALKMVDSAIDQGLYHDIAYKEIFDTLTEKYPEIEQIILDTAIRFYMERGGKWPTQDHD